MQPTSCQEDSTSTLSVIAPLHAQLLHDTEAAGVAADTPVVREIKLAIHEDLVKKFKCAQDKRMLYTASLLDPRFKALPFLTKKDQLEVHANVVAEAAAYEVNYIFLNNIYFGNCITHFYTLKIYVGEI